MKGEQSGTGYILFALSALTVATGSTAQGVANDPVAETGIKNICQEDAYLTKILEHTKAKTSDIKTEISKQKSKVTLYRLAAAKADDHDTRCLMLALAADNEVALEKNTNELQRATATIESFVAQLAEHKALLKAAHQVSAITLAPDGGDKHSATGNPAFTATLTLAAARGPPTCSFETASSRETFGGREPDLDKLYELKLTDDTKIPAMFTQTEIKLKANTGCTAKTDASLQSALHQCTFDQGTAAATFTKTPPDYTKLTTQTKIFKDNDNKASCDATVAEANSKSPRHQQLARAICDAMKLKPTTTRATPESGEALKTSKLIKTVIRNCVKTFHSINDVTDAEKAKALTTFIESSYGKTSEDFTSKFKTLLENEDTPTRGAGEPEKKKITDIMAATQTAEALSQMEGIRIKQELETAEKMNSISKTVDNKKSEECKGETDKDK